MTLQRIILSEDLLVYNFSSKEREYLRLIAARANDCLDLVLTNQATARDRDEYHALKFVLKRAGAIDKALLERLQREKVKGQKGRADASLHKMQP